MNSQKLFESVFVSLGGLDQAINAECRNDAYSREDYEFDQFSHKFLLEIFLFKDI